MYAWIWRKLPFGLPGKVIGSAVLAGLAVALLWFVVFPWAEPLLPFDDSQVIDDGSGGAPADGGPVGGDPDGGTSGPEGGAPDGGDPDGGGLGEHDLPYDTESSNPEPSSDNGD
ncbi:hypothetical protein O7632_02350 [Solwaraspora sp. WMMD406]|uniref:hypothetical protein n=1 Tax=Solwaraspora sp. WMMD406 TaxID=3016095 RepID=UPI002415E8CC|nr:hypothetical protein [Solwaraspora sp. WMMD406]MDG4762958.1 hypothetical protein [Solwaraspora sp. WMMD406]